MKKEAKLLKDKGVSSILLSIDHFNRVSEMGRSEAVLIFLDHSFEMLLKAGILAKGGKIREPREANTIGFDKCVRKALSDTPFLTDEQALVLQAINGLRDAAQHHLLDLSEGQLYFHAQSGVTLFRDVLKDVFNEDLADALPSRVLPVSTIVPADPLEMFATELDAVKQLLAPGRRHRAEAEAKLRGLAIVDGALQGRFVQPSESELRKLGTRLAGGEKFDQLFPGIGAVTFQTDGIGPSLSLRIEKRKGVPVTVVPEGTPGSGVIALKRVDELGFYSLGHNELAKKVGLTTNKTTAVIRVIGIKDDLECYKEIVIGRSKYQRYSQNAILRIKDLLTEKSVDDIWVEYRAIQQSPKN